MSQRFLLVLGALGVWTTAALAATLGTHDPVRRAAIEAIAIVAAVVGLAAARPTAAFDRPR